MTKGLVSKLLLSTAMLSMSLTAMANEDMFNDMAQFIKGHWHVKGADSQYTLFIGTKPRTLTETMLRNVSQVSKSVTEGTYCKLQTVGIPSFRECTFEEMLPHNLCYKKIMEGGLASNYVLGIQVQSVTLLPSKYNGADCKDYVARVKKNIKNNVTTRQIPIKFLFDGDKVSGLLRDGFYTLHPGVKKAVQKVAAKSDKPVVTVIKKEPVKNEFTPDANEGAVAPAAESDVAAPSEEGTTSSTGGQVTEEGQGGASGTTSSTGEEVKAAEEGTTSSTGGEGGSGTTSSSTGGEEAPKADDSAE